MGNDERVETGHWLDGPDQCRPCHGPVLRKTKLGMIRDYVCYVAVLWWPERFFMSRPHTAILPYAGNHAFSCTCWPRIADGPWAAMTQDQRDYPIVMDSAAIAQPPPEDI